MHFRASVIKVLLGVMCIMFNAPLVKGNEVRQYIQYIQSENFKQLENELSQLEKSKEKNTDGMYSFYQTVNRLGEDLARDPESSLELLNKWCQQSPSYLSHLVRGIFYTDFAWAERGSKYSNKVLPEVWQSFKGGLELARKDLEQAAALNTQSAEPWIALEIVYRGLSMPEGVAQSFERAIAIDPNHYNAYSMMLVAKMEKWFGSHQEMFEFANKSYDAHRDDPVFAFLLIVANDELAKRTAFQTDGKRSDYYKIPVNYTKVRSLIDEVLRSYPNSLRAQSWSVTIDYMVGKHAEALKQMEAMGNDVDEDVWGKKSSFLETKAWLERQRSKGVF